MLRTDRHTDGRTDADERFTPATVVGMSNDDGAKHISSDRHHLHIMLITERNGLLTHRLMAN